MHLNGPRQRIKGSLGRLNLETKGKRMSSEDIVKRESESAVFLIVSLPRPTLMTLFSFARTMVMTE
jgi:hypothetical protein